MSRYTNYSRPGSYFRQVGGNSYGPGGNPRKMCNEVMRQYTVRVPILGAFTEQDATEWEDASVNIYGKTNSDQSLNWKPSRVYDNKSFLEINTNTVPVNCYYLTLTMDSLNPLFTMMRKEGDSFSNYKIDPTITFRANYGNTSLAPSIYVAFTPLGWNSGFPISTNPMETDSGFTLTTGDYERTITLSQSDYPTVAYWGRLANNRALTGMAYDNSKKSHAFNQLSDALQIVINPVFPQLMNGSGDLGLKKDQVQMYVEIDFNVTFINQSLTKSITNYAAWEAANFETSASPSPTSKNQEIGGVYAQAFSQSTSESNSRAWKIAKKNEKFTVGKTLPVVKSKKLIHNTAQAKDIAKRELTQGIKDEKLKKQILSETTGSIVFGSADSESKGVSLHLSSELMKQYLDQSITGDASQSGNKEVLNHIMFKYYTASGADVLAENLPGSINISSCGQLFQNGELSIEFEDPSKPIQAFQDSSLGLYHVNTTSSGQTSLASPDETVAVVVPFDDKILSTLKSQGIEQSPRIEITAQQVIMAPSTEEKAPVSGFSDFENEGQVEHIQDFGVYETANESTTDFPFNRASAYNSIPVDIPDAIKMMGKETTKQYVEMVRKREYNSNAFLKTLTSLGASFLNGLSSSLSQNSMGGLSNVAAKGSLGKANNTNGNEDLCDISEKITGPNGKEGAKTAKIIVQDLTGAVALTETTPTAEIKANFANFESALKYSVDQCQSDKAQYIKVSFGCEYSFEGTPFFSPLFFPYEDTQKPILWYTTKQQIDNGEIEAYNYYSGQTFIPDCFVDVYPTVMISKLKPTDENFFKACVPVGNPADNFIRYTLQPIDPTDTGKCVLPGISNGISSSLVQPMSAGGSLDKSVKIPAFCYPLNLSNAITINMNVPIPLKLPDGTGKLLDTQVGDELYVVLVLTSRVTAQQKKYKLLENLHSTPTIKIGEDLLFTNQVMTSDQSCPFLIAGFCPGNQKTMTADGTVSANTLSKCINASSVSFLVQSCTSFNDTE